MSDVIERAHRYLDDWTHVVQSKSIDLIRDLVLEVVDLRAQLDSASRAAPLSVYLAKGAEARAAAQKEMP